MPTRGRSVAKTTASGGAFNHKMHSLLTGHSVQGRASSMPPSATVAQSLLRSADVTTVMQNVNKQHVGMDAFASTNVGQGNNDPESDSESDSSVVKTKTRLKTVMVACLMDNIKSQEVLPHCYLNYGFVTQVVEFHQITYEQYIASERKTLFKCSDPNEIRGCLNLLICISYLKQKGYSWPNFRTLYAVIVNHIEKHESSWVSDWRHIEDMVLDAAIRVPGEKSGGHGMKNRVVQFYCRNFNKPEGCQLMPPMRLMWGGNTDRLHTFVHVATTQHRKYVITVNVTPRVPWCSDIHQIHVRN